MAQTTVFKNFFGGLAVPPGGTLYFFLGPHPRFGAGAITVTAFAARGVSGVAPDYVEIVQMATRRQSAGTEEQYFLDCVVRNNDQHGNWHDAYWVYTSVSTP